ncbi:hypothetical protein F3Y22_tig00010533pilonHSYRG00161 [Hibiscus syriacus]|uniref:Pentatricopeptide repeat-containing protein n=1 Tax=Hibiscus syriacus TaxID=106335 RepID=A0A6A3C925_HIBSY|nr:hypothetical protein F3Y22_tig00010533pilonHSYRG00161 [Hibiscus syriacus]
MTVGLLNRGNRYPLGGIGVIGTGGGVKSSSFSKWNSNVDGGDDSIHSSGKYLSSNGDHRIFYDRRDRRRKQHNPKWKNLCKSSGRASRCQSHSRGSCRRRFDELHEKNVVLWNAMIGGFVQNGYAYADEVLVLFSQMKGSDSHPDEFTYTRILSACASLGCLEIVSLTCILNACANVQSLEQGKQVHFLAVKSGLDKSLYVGSSLIDMYAKSGAIGDAYKVLYDMSQWSVVSMNSMISGYEPNDLDRAIILLKDMHVDGLKPSEVIRKMTAMRRPYTSSERCVAAMYCPTKLHFYVSDELTTSALVDMNTKCGEVKCSVQVFNEMNSKNGISCWNLMIFGFAKNGYAEDALRIFFLK